MSLGQRMPTTSRSISVRVTVEGQSRDSIFNVQVEGENGDDLISIEGYGAAMSVWVDGGYGDDVITAHAVLGQFVGNGGDGNDSIFGPFIPWNAGPSIFDGGAGDDELL